MIQNVLTVVNLRLKDVQSVVRLGIVLVIASLDNGKVINQYVHYLILAKKKKRKNLKVLKSIRRKKHLNLKNH
jgi:hypothetical protein